MKRKNSQKNGDFSLAHVLYQKLGNDWYAFTEVDGDCFMTKVDPQVAAQERKNLSGETHELRNFRKRKAA